ncbi:amino acid ABC transporter substrate-binding protein [Oceanibaculum indicum]|uniref:Branched-chain amino acid transport system substrate-binding protein n=1 Tax=Oceanibaculum indicum TaxID=526216 RepID=A0A420WN62_9PROT|nr:amino acid ABC transporter substrate-binding protein [Oceanibaculum indicum]RKQ72430.1 branched-chain amino acid transport system substrate-binding protein [Oceanibaculum indicum]
MFGKFKDTAFVAAAAVALVSTASLPSAANAADVLRIGAPLALTGGLADEGKKQEGVWQLWLDKVNANGGIKVGGKTMKVELVKYDYQTDGKRAGQLAEKLVTDDKVDVLMAPFGSGHTKIVAAVAERYQVPLLACVASSESVYDQGFKYLFGTLAPNGGMTDAMAVMFKEKMPSTTKIAVYGRDDVFPKSMATAMAKSAESAGLKVVYNELYAVGTMDHSAALSAIKAASPDWIYMTGYTQDLILGRKQMKDLGIEAPIITMVTGPAYREFTEGLGDLADGVTSSTWWHHATAYTGATGVWDTTAGFYKDFTAAFKTDPDYVHASCAAAADVLVNAVQKAGSTDKAKVRDALAATDMLTFYGPIKFGANGMNQGREMPVIQVQGKDIKVLYPASIANADMIAVK